MVVDFLLRIIPEPSTVYKDWRFIALTMNGALASNLIWLISHPETPPAGWMFWGSVVATLWELEVFAAPYVLGASVPILAGTLLAAFAYLWFRITRKGDGGPPQTVRTLLTLAFCLNLASALPHVIGFFILIDIMIANLTYLGFLLPDEVMLAALAKHPQMELLAACVTLIFLIVVQGLLASWLIFWVWDRAPKISLRKGGTTHGFKKPFASNYSSGD